MKRQRSFQLVAVLALLGQFMPLTTGSYASLHAGNSAFISQNIMGTAKMTEDCEIILELFRAIGAYQAVYVPADTKITSDLIRSKSASRLEYDLVRQHNTDTWSLNISSPNCNENTVSHVALWCTKCGTGSSTTATTFHHTLIATTPVHSTASVPVNESGGTVVLVLQDSTIPSFDSTFKNNKELSLQSHRKLQQVSTCSGPLTVGSTAIPFDNCEVVYTDFNFYYTLLPSGLGTLLKGGMLVKTNGWASFARAPTGTMIGSDAIIVYPDSSSLTGASVTGISLTSYEIAANNRDKGTFPLLDASAVKNPDGTLAATFTVKLQEAPTLFIASPMSYLFVVNGIMGVSNDLRGHSGPGAMTSGGNLQFKLSSAPQPVPSTAPGPSSTTNPSPSLTPNSSLAPAPSPSAPSCMLTVANEVKTYRVCYPVPFGKDFKVYYSLEADLSDATSSILSMGMQATSSGWIAVGFPSKAGKMTNAGAAILKACTNCTTGAALDQYYMNGTEVANVNMDTRMNITDPRASGANGIISGSWKMKLPGVSVTTRRRRLLQMMNFPASSFPLIYAVGPISSTGAIQEHKLPDSGDGEINLLAGLPGATGGAVVAPISTKDIYKTAHMWIAAASWGIIIPVSILISRYLQPHARMWFNLHRIVSSLGFLGGVAALVLGLKINGWQWETDWPIHRNLGVSCTALGLVQMFSLIKWLRPDKDTKWRPYWFFFHSWFGRFAALVGIGNIYYAIFFVEELGLWAWATYSGILGGIVVVALIMEVVNWRVRRKEEGEGGEWKIMQLSNGKGEYKYLK